jgi:hypothetical protein
LRDAARGAFFVQLDLQNELRAGDRIAAITRFDATLFAQFGLPRTIPKADRSEAATCHPLETEEQRATASSIPR